MLYQVGKILENISGNLLKYLRTDPVEQDIGLLNVMNPASRPIQVTAMPGMPVQTVPGWDRIDMDPSKSNVTAMTGSHLAVVVPVKGDRYILMCMGNDAYVAKYGQTASAGCSGIPCPNSIPMGPTRLYADLDVIAGSGNFYLLHLID